MADPIDLTERMPHYTMKCEDGLHVVPEACLRDMAAGRLPLDALPASVIRKVVGDFLWFAERAE